MRRSAALALVLVAASAAPAGAGAADSFALGATGGWIKPDGRLADYQWDTRPGASFGVSARADRGPWGAGVRLLSASSTQDVGAETAAAVHTTRLELVGRRRVARAWGHALFVTASAGRAHLGYDPDQVTIDTGGSGPVTVDLVPVNSAVLGAGLAIERAVGRRVIAGFELDGARYAFDTAHRDGDTIVRERTAFTDWGARFTLAWRSAPN